MIFVTLGTQDKSFERLLKAIDLALVKNKIKDKVVVQAGHTKYSSSNMEIFSFMTKDEFESYIEKADLIITHGGAGSILTAMKKNKKIIAIARLAKYKEHTNDHQLQIINALYNDGYILKCDNLDEIAKVVKEAKKFEAKKYSSNNKLMLNTITKYITDTNNKNKSLLILSLFIILIIIIILLLV